MEGAELPFWDCKLGKYTLPFPHQSQVMKVQMLEALTILPTESVSFSRQGSYQSTC